jgi:hypothetical protein
MAVTKRLPNHSAIPHPIAPQQYGESFPAKRVTTPNPAGLTISSLIISLTPWALFKDRNAVSTQAMAMGNPLGLNH